MFCEQGYIIDRRSCCLDLTSTIEKVPLARDNYNMNKFGTLDEEDFKRVRVAMEELVDKSAEVLANRCTCPHPQLDLCLNHLLAFLSDLIIRILANRL
jgi:hypothetical protein